MEQSTMEQLQKLGQIFNSKALISPDQIEQVLKGITIILANYRNSTNAINENTKNMVAELLQKVNDAHEANEGKIQEDVEQKHGEFTDKVDKQIADLKDMFDQVMSAKPMDGENADPEEVVPLVMKQILENMPEQLLPDEPADIVDKLTTLEDEDRLPVSAIEEVSLTDFIKAVIVSTFRGKAIPTFRVQNTNGGGVQSVTSKDNSVTIKASGAKGKGVVDLSVTASGGITFEQPLGTIDNANTSFTVVHVPKFINVNGAIYAVTQGQYTSLTPGSPNTIALANPVGTGGFIGSYY